MNLEPISTALVGLIVVPIALVLWLALGERFVLLFRSSRAQESARAGVWLVIPAILGGGILLYPLVQTVVMSFLDADGVGFVGLDNYAWAFSDTVLPVLVNNLIWIVVLPVVTLLLGVLLAALAERVRYEWLVRTVMVLPIAISFTAAAVIWRLVYAYQPSGAVQTGTLNALLNLVGLDSVAFLSDPSITTFSLIAVGVWMSVGLCMLMTSAAMKNLDTSVLEAARLDGAGEVTSLLRIVVPQIAPTLGVVYTTQLIFSLKVFDIVYTMTNGAFNTDVIANRMFSELFRARDYGHASAIAVLLLVVAIPIIVINVRQFRSEKS
jgi:alpha-glucoside transport system permease protein